MKEFPFIIMTGKGNVDLGEEYNDLNILVLEKPFKMNPLKEEIEKAIKKFAATNIATVITAPPYHSSRREHLSRATPN